MREYRGKSKSLKGLAITIGVLALMILFITLLAGIKGISLVFIAFFAFIISFIYKGMILKITVDDEKITIYKPLTRKTIKFANIAFCMIHGIDESEFIVYAFVKKKIGNRTYVRGVKQKLSFEEVVKSISKTDHQMDLDINFNFAEKIPVSFVEKSEDLKQDILNTLGGYQKEILKKK